MSRAAQWAVGIAAAAVLLGTAVPARAAKWALLVGVEHYQREDVAPLRYAKADVQAVARALAQTCGVPEEHIFLLAGDDDPSAEPTRPNLTFRLEWLARKVQPGDLFVFYFSGHGMVKQGRSLLLTAESDARSAETLEDTAYPVERLQQLLRRVEASQVLLFVDACRNDPAGGRGAGDNALDEEFARSVVVRPRGASSAESEGEGAAVFYACKVGQRAYDWPSKGRGFFSVFVEEGLRGAAADAQGRVTVDGLEEYLAQRVPEATERELGVRQEPWVERSGTGTGGWVLAQAEPRAPEAVRELATAGTLRVRSLPLGATVAVDGESLATTPCDLTIPLGAAAEKTVMVSVDKAGYAPRTAEVTVYPGRVSAWDDVQLAPLARPISTVPSDPYRSRQASAEPGGYVEAVAFSPDGRLLASGADDGMVTLSEVTGGACVGSLLGHLAPVYAVAFSADGRLLASASEDGTVKVWDVLSRECLATLLGHEGPVYAVAFRPDGRVLASGSADRTIRLWEVATGECLGTLPGHGSPVYSLAFSPDGLLLASGSADCTARLWEVSRGQCVRTLSGHSRLVFSVAFSPDGRLLATGSADHTVRLWEVDRGESLATFPALRSSALSVAFSPDGEMLAAGSPDGTVTLWEVARQQSVGSYAAPRGAAFAVAFGPDGGLLASAGRRAAALWRPRTRAARE
jgi:hypothetical protein